MTNAVSLLYATAPNEETALRIGRTLVEERLAACANILGTMRSIYRWRDEIEDEMEVAFLIKTSAVQARRTVSRIIELHPYEEPCVLGFSPDTILSAPDFLAWILDQTTTPAPTE